MKPTPQNNRNRNARLPVIAMLGLLMACIWGFWPAPVDPVGSLLAQYIPPRGVNEGAWPIVVELPSSSLGAIEIGLTAQESFLRLLAVLDADRPHLMVLTDFVSLWSMRELPHGVEFEAVQSRLLTPRYALLGGHLAELPSLLGRSAAPPADAFWQEGVIAAPQGRWGVVFKSALWHPSAEGFRPSLSLAIVRHASAPENAPASSALFRPIPVQTAEGDDLTKSFYFILSNRAMALKRYPAADVLAGRLPRGLFRDRVLVLGTTAVSEPSGVSTALITAAMSGALANGLVWQRPSYLVWLEAAWIVLLTLTPQGLGRQRCRQPSGMLAVLAIASLMPLFTWLIWQVSGMLFQTGFAALGLLLSWGVVLVWPNEASAAVAAAKRWRPSDLIQKHGDISPTLASASGAQSDTPEGFSPPNPKAENQAANRSLAPGSDEDPTPDEALSPAIMPLIGRYEIIRAIGRGAMSEVFLGRDPHINRMTAIKCIRFEDSFAADEVNEIKERFFREAESAGKLSHPNIVTIYDAGEAGDTAYIAMEYLDGMTLLRFTRKRHLLPARQVLGHMAQVAIGLEYAHSQGIVHRDIKPANIMLLPSGKIKITDFGIARIAATSQTQTGVVKGTPYYMSPEQFSGEKVDGRSDVFSLGTLLFQLVTGTLPFFSESPAILMNQIMNFPHPNPRAINPNVMPGVIRIIDHALEKDRANRYQRAADMAQDLRALSKKIDDHRKRRAAAGKDTHPVG